MFFEHVYERGLAQSSYLVGCQATGSAVVVDPRRDIDVYLQIAEREGLQIEAVTETHIHADYLSGARELAAATGATLYLSDEGGDDWQYGFPHAGLRDGDTISVGNVRLEVLHTPGHTPEHLSFLLYDEPTGPEPRMLFTGDFVFVGDLGRPDLLEMAAGVVGSRETGARQMYSSLRRLRDLPSGVLVWPGHGAGSACGKSLGAVPVTTLGYERATGWAFRVDGEDEFVDQLLDGQPEPPRYFGTMKRLNRSRPETTVRPILPAIPQWSAGEVVRIAGESVDDGDGGAAHSVQVVDTRASEVALARPIPGALSVPVDEGMSTWFGWLLDYDSDIVIVVDPEHREAVQRSLFRIGLDRIIGWADATAVDAAVADGAHGAEIPSVDPGEVERMRTEGATVLDVRGAGEVEEDRIPGSRHIHLGYLADRAAELDGDRPVVVHCQGGYRSVIACSVLRRAGFSSVFNLAGGFDAWKAATARSATGEPSAASFR